jgi:hypothetical protein
MKRGDVVDYRYLAKTTSYGKLIPITYTIKMKRANPENGFALSKLEIISSVQRNIPPVPPLKINPLKFRSVAL